MNEKVLRTLSNYYYCRMMKQFRKNSFSYDFDDDKFSPLLLIFFECKVYVYSNTYTRLRLPQYWQRNFQFCPIAWFAFPFLFFYSFVLFFAIFHFKLPVLSTGNKIIALELKLEKIAPMITRIERGFDSEKMSVLFSNSSAR